MQPMNSLTRGDVFPCGPRMITFIQTFLTPDTHHCLDRSAGLLFACIFISVLFASPSLSAKLGRFFRTGSTPDEDAEEHLEGGWIGSGSVERRIGSVRGGVGRISSGELLAGGRDAPAEVS